ncbi:hypothetical protein [Lacunimicrobium album]
MATTSPSPPPKGHRLLTWSLLIILPLIISAIPACVLFAPVDPILSLTCGLLAPAACVFLSSLIAIGKLTFRQGAIIFLGTVLAPAFTLLLAAIIPSSLYRLIPIRYGRDSVMFDFTCASLTMWLFIACLFVLAFRRRLPTVFIPAIGVSAVIAPALACMLVLTPDGFAIPRDPTFERAVIFYSIFSFPAIVLGILLFLYANVIRNDQFPELMYLPDEGPSPTP